MNSLTASQLIPATTPDAIAKLEQLEAAMLQLPQALLDTIHTLHAGVYTRTIMIPAGVAITGALIKVATTIIVSGQVMVFIGDTSKELAGYHVLPASAGRKQAFIAKADTWLTMLFKTDAKTVEEAENEFTDDADRLLSRHPASRNLVTITEG